MGCMILLQSVVPDLRGKRAVVIGKSNIVGKPVALLLLEQGCTVIVCNRHTVDLADVCRSADIIVAAAGRSEEHTSELQSLMRITSAVFCLNKKTQETNQ